MTYRPFHILDLSKAAQALKWPDDNAGATVPVLVDLNKDGQLDFVFHFSQMQSAANWGAVTTAPTPNRLIAMVSQPDGSYADQTAQVFAGVSDSNLPGMSRKAAVGDLNQDGIADWAYALNREDGRSGSPAVNSTSKAAAVLSNANGTYSVVELGSNNWYHSVYLDNLLFGTPTVILAGYYNSPSFGSNAEGYYLGGGYGYTWSNQTNSFSQGIALPTHPNTFVSLKDTAGTPAILSVINANTGEQLLALFSQVNNRWTLTDKFTPYPSKMVNFVSYSMDRGTAELFLIEPGVYGTAAGYSESQAIALSPGDTATAVFKLGAAQISAPRSDGYYYQNDGQPIQKLDFYRANGTSLQKLPITVIHEDKEVNANFMDVLDFNADGLSDLVVYPYEQGAKPDVYLNTGGNVFIKVDEAIFPAAPAQWGIGATTKMSDLNGDGILDLLYAPLNGFSLSDTQQLQWQTYLGDSVYDASSIATALNISDRLGSTLIHTWAGNDKILDIGSTGAPAVIEAGAGIDIAVYSGTADQYRFTPTGSDWHVTGGMTSSVNDTLTGVERLEFSDKFIALNLNAGAGEVAKTLGAVFGKSFVSNKEYVGIGLHYSDTLQYSYTALMQLAIHARLGAYPSSAQVVDLLYTNVVGTAPDAATRQSFTDLLDNQTFTAASLGIFAADTALNKANVDLVGLTQTGLAYLPVGA